MTSKEQEPSRTIPWSMMILNYIRLLMFCSHLATCKIVETTLRTSPILRSTWLIIPQMLLKYNQMTQHTATFSNYNLNGIEICSIDITMRCTMMYIVDLSLEIMYVSGPNAKSRQNQNFDLSARPVHWNCEIPACQNFEPSIQK